MNIGGSNNAGTRGRLVYHCVLIVAALGSGCVGAPEEEEIVEDTFTSFEEFEAQAYREPETGIYIVDGDTPIDDIKKLEEFYEAYVQEGALIVHRSGGSDAIWNDTQKLDLRYCVSTTFGSKYSAAVQAMKDATAAWEAVADVKYIHVSTEDGNCNAQNSNVLFDVRPTNSGGSYLARAFFPGDSRGSRNVLVDNGAFGNNGPTTLTGILRHELGHTLGFRHEHTRPEAGTCFEDNQWRQLTTYDSASVMHYPQCNGTGDKTLSLTAKDKQGAALLYGAPGSGPADPGNPPGDPPGNGPSTESFSGSVAKGKAAFHGPLDVAPGTTFEVTMSGSGDPDLYVRFGAKPTFSKWDCRPYKTGASESCSLTVPQGQSKAYLAVYGYAAGQYQLAVTYTSP